LYSPNFPGTVTNLHPFLLSGRKAPSAPFLQAREAPSFPPRLRGKRWIKALSKRRGLRGRRKRAAEVPCGGRGFRRREEPRDSGAELPLPPAAESAAYRAPKASPCRASRH